MLAPGDVGRSDGPGSGGRRGRAPSDALPVAPQPGAAVETATASAAAAADESSGAGRSGIQTLVPDLGQAQDRSPASPSRKEGQLPDGHLGRHRGTHPGPPGSHRPRPARPVLSRHGGQAPAEAGHTPARSPQGQENRATPCRSTLSRSGSPATAPSSSSLPLIAARSGARAWPPVEPPARPPSASSQLPHKIEQGKPLPRRLQPPLQPVKTPPSPRRCGCPGFVDRTSFEEEVSTMPRSRPRYPAEYRQQMVELVRSEPGPTRPRVRAFSAVDPQLGGPGGP